jgi:hypothetical protein
LSIQTFSIRACSWRVWVGGSFELIFFVLFARSQISMGPGAGLLATAHLEAKHRRGMSFWINFTAPDAKHRRGMSFWINFTAPDFSPRVLFATLGLNRSNF